MKIVVIGGTGLIGSKLVAKLVKRGHKAVAASPSTGVNTVTGVGLEDVLRGAQVVVDVSESPSFEEEGALEFFTASNRNLLRAETVAGAGHHVALSVVGTERLQESGYFRGKLAQEALIKASQLPYSIVRATQFFEFAGSIAQSSASGDAVQLSSALFQPIAADDVATALADVALAPPLNATLEIAGPESRPMSELVETWMRANGDERPVIADPNARYFGLAVNDASLRPDAGARIMPTRFADWLERSKVSQQETV